MYYAPHILQVRNSPEEVADEFGRPIIMYARPLMQSNSALKGGTTMYGLNGKPILTPSQYAVASSKFLAAVNDTTYSNVARCRCDHNGEAEVKGENGAIVKPDYHIVIDGNRPGVKVGDYIRCLDKDGETRAEGYVLKLKLLNTLPYAEIFV